MRPMATGFAAPAIPGFGHRGVDRGRDPAEMAEMSNRANAADDVDDRNSEAELRNWLLRETPHYDPATDLVVATVDGSMVAYAWVDWVDTTDGLREYRLGGCVDTAWRRRGIGRWLVRWGEARATELARAHATDTGGRGLVLGTWTPEQRVGKRVLFEQEGYGIVRWFNEMARHDLEAVELPPLPAGIEVRVPSAEEIRTVYDADVEAFRDHWGGFDSSDEAYASFLSDPNLDPNLWVVAWAGHEVAGASINAISAAENAAREQPRGWLESVFVRRPWRGRGLASALVARSLERLAAAGMASAVLGVDSENPTGAMRVYEKNGFVVERRAAAYRKPLALG
ncbi:MAG: GNAT family N-acetyltransferase [Chloroflexota bacterium]|nr:GNAT family N-acetyltransferase [Chloroflexota bacterium]